VHHKFDFMWTRTSVPRGAMGVASKESKPSSAVCAKSRGFCQLGQSMLKVASHCGVSRHQFDMGKDLERPAMLARK
jgi:hypothetical protein